MVSIHSEGTFGRLRYSFGGDRPSQTAHLTLSIHRFHGAMLEFQQQKSGIPTAAPPSPKAWFPCLPPILCIRYRNPISGYSKAPWGLSVLSQVTGIFTGISISPSPLLRQRPDRFAFRAGRNLPDKEFRYLRTVIVTAAVYWGFSSKLALFPLTFQHRAGVSHYTSSYDFAMTCVFAKQSPGPFHCDSPALCFVLTHAREQPFSRSYGFILQSSLTRVISRALVFSTCLPVSVCGTGTCIFLSSFSWQRRIKDFVTIFHSSSCLRIFEVWSFLHFSLLT